MDQFTFFNIYTRTTCWRCFIFFPEYGFGFFVKDHTPIDMWTFSASNEMIMIFFLDFDYIVDYVDWFQYNKPFLYPWDKVYLILVNDCFVCSWIHFARIVLSSRLVVAHAFNPSTWEADAGGFLSSRSAWSTKWVPGQPDLYIVLANSVSLLGLFIYLD